MKKIYRVLTVIGIMAIVGCQNQEANTEVQSTQTETETSAPAGQAFLEPVEGETPNILQIAAGSPDHKMLVAAVQAAAIENVLANNGPLTVFAPIDAAFEALPEGTVETLLKPENKATLARILTFHAAPGKYGPNNIKGVMGIGQATGDKVVVEVTKEGTFVNGAKVLGSVEASNGYVHVIDGVLLPPDKK